MRSYSIGGLFFLSIGLPLYAAPALTGNPLGYQAISPNRADTTLQEIQSRALSGHLTTADILKAAEQIKAVQEASSKEDTTALPVDPVRESVAAPPSAVAPSYARQGTDLQISIDDSAYPLSAGARLQLTQILNRFPLRQLFLIQQIQIMAPANDPDHGALEVQTIEGHITVYGTRDLSEAVTEGVASVVFQNMQGSPLAVEWQTHGDYADFLQSYQAWVQNTSQAFDETKQSGQAPGELSKLFFMASLFMNDSQNRITTFNPMPQEVPWQIQEGHYGFGPYSFEVYRNQIVHFSKNGVLLTASAATIPSLWIQQGLGN